MAHKYLVGMTESGKTTLAKMMNKTLIERGKQTAVLDPLMDKDWNTEYVFSDPDEFLEFAQRNKEFFLFVDEGAQSVGRYNVSMQWLATTSRHWGHSCIFISQGVTQVAPIVRQQCGMFFVFACGEQNTAIIAEETREPMLKNLLRIPKLEFYIVSRFDTLQKGKIIFPEKGEFSLDKLQIVYNEVVEAPQ